MTLSENEQRVCRAIKRREGQLKADLSEHVAIPTGQGYAAGLERYRAALVARLQTIGASIQTVAGTPRPHWLTMPGQCSNVEAPPPPTTLAHHIARPPTRRILLAGHLDTVHDPHGPFQQLTLQPDGRTAIGPGVVDMKGGVLVGIAALEAIHECNLDLSWTFLLNSDEETGSFHSFDALTAAAREHDVGIALEPALPDGSLAIERMGAGQFKIEVFGKPAHVGREFARGVSAVVKLAELITALARLSEPEKGLIVNVGPLQGGPVTNVVPDYAACWGNVRFANQEGAALLACRLDSFATTPDAMPRVVIHHLFNRPSKSLIEPVRHLAELARAAAADLGQSLPFSSTGGVCDGNILQAAGLPTIDTLGVRGGNLHRPDEFIEMVSLVERAQLLAVLLLRLSHV